MKSLENFINDLQKPFAKGSLLFDSIIPNADYSKLWCCESPGDANYEDFLLRNSLEYTTESYKLYQYMSFIESIKRMSKKFSEVIDEDGYEVFQKTHSVNETLLHSYDVHLLIDKLSKIVNIDDIQYLHPNRKTTHVEFNVNKKDEDKLNSEDVEHLLHQYNYYVRRISETETEYHIELEPYKPEELTDKIYDDYEGIIYHCTLKSKVDKIINGEIVPKGKSDLNGFRPKLSYYIIGEPKEAKHGLRQIMNLNIMLSKGKGNSLAESDFAFLRIDLNKFNRKIKFRLDSSGTYDKVITEEPIPGYCCKEIKLGDMK